MSIRGGIYLALAEFLLSISLCSSAPTVGADCCVILDDEDRGCRDIDNFFTEHDCDESGGNVELGKCDNIHECEDGVHLDAGTAYSSIMRFLRALSCERLAELQEAAGDSSGAREHLELALEDLDTIISRYPNWMWIDARARIHLRLGNLYK